MQQGAALPAEEREKIVAELARLTGLKPQVIEDNHLRIDSGVFRKQLLHDEGMILGAYDARITGRDDDPASPYPDFDPSYAATYGPFSAAMNAYVREELKFEDDLPYEIIAGVQPWNYGAHNNYPSVSDQLASVMNQNPYMRVLVLGGLRDLVCPPDTMRYCAGPHAARPGLSHEHHLRHVRSRPHDVRESAGLEKDARGAGRLYQAVGCMAKL